VKCAKENAKEFLKVMQRKGREVKGRSGLGDFDVM
jgi:hypothetical protein